MAQYKSLGKGLGALISSKTKNEISEENNFTVLIDKIDPNPHQPRKDFNQKDLEDLADSIVKHGILQPLVVSKKDGRFQLIAGERRLRAAKLAGLERVPVILRSAEEQAKLELALIENLQRQDLNPLEEAWAYESLINEFNLTHEELAKRLGKSRPVISNGLRLLSLPQEIQEALINKKISGSYAKVIAGFKTEEEQLRFFKQIIKRGYNLQETEEIKRRFSKKKKDPNLSSQEEALREVLGTKVLIKKRGSSGRVIIGFYSEEELKNIIGKIIK